MNHPLYEELPLNQPTDHQNDGSELSEHRRSNTTGGEPVSVLHPFMSEPSPFGPDDELGDTAHYGPVEGSKTVIAQLRVEKPAVLVFHVPFEPASEPAQEALRAVLERRWTRRHILNLAGGPDAVEYYLRQIIEYASYVRVARAAGMEEGCGSPWTAAAVICSYLPDESVPAGPAATLQQMVALLSTEEPGALDFQYGYAAALAVLATGGVDGAVGRQRLARELDQPSDSETAGLCICRAVSDDEAGGEV